MKFYVLDGHTPVPVDDGVEMVMQSSAARTQTPDPWLVARTHIFGKAISTVFIGVSTSLRGEPLVFETAIFDKDDSVEIFGRCSTWDQAEAQHEACVIMVKGGLK